MIFARSGGMGSVFEGDETVPFEKKDTPFTAKVRKGRGRKRGWRAFRNVKPLDTQANVIVAEQLAPSEMTMVEDQPELVGDRLVMKRANRVRRYRRDADFSPADTVAFPGDEVEDIRPMGPLELPDYTERRPSALGYFGQDAATAAAATAAAKTAEQPWYSSIATSLAPILQAGAQAYQQYQSLKRPKAATTTVYRASTDTSSSNVSTGLKPWHWVAIIGGGVVVLGTAAILILRK